MARSAGYNVIRSLLDKFPTAPALTIAKRAVAENPDCWSSVESCRRAVRVQLGVAGKRNRGNVADKTHFREPRKAGWSDVIPENLGHIGVWEAVRIDGPHKALVLSDVHIPFHDRDALELALQYGADRKATLILLNGDIVDHYALSRWETNPKLRDFPAEVRATIKFLSGLRKAFPKARIVYKHGNHEERYERYLRLKAPELLGVDAFEWSEIYSLADHDIELVSQKRPILLGDLNVIHGHEYVFQISNPVNPARGMYLRAKAHVLGGHFHQTSQHSEKSIEQKVFSAWSTSALCDLHPEYRPLNPWNHGFAFVEIDKDGAFRVENLRIVAGKVW